MSTTTEDSGTQQGVRIGDRRKWWALAVVAVAQLMTVLDLAVVYVALPSMQRSLGISLADRQWVVSAYAISFGGLLLLGGRLVDRLGRKRTFVWALLAFGAASALGGAATSGGMLFAARALQGSMAAVVAPAVLSLVTVTFTERAERATAFAVFGMVSGSGAAIGLIAGGVLTQYGSWRWCLFINVPLAVIVAAAGAVALRGDEPAPRRGYDLAGSVTVTLGLACLAEGFTRAEPDGWGSSATLVPLALGAALIAAFVAIELRSDAPLLPLRIVTEYHRALLYLAALLANAAQLSLFLFLTYYFQTTRQYSALHTGFAFLPFALAVILTANVSASRVVRAAPITLMLTGAVLSTGALLAFSTLSAADSYPTRVMLPEVLMGMGVALSLFPLNNVVLAGIDPADAGVASAAIATTQQMGGSLGNSLLNSVYGIAVAGYVAVGLQRGDSTGAAMRGYDVVFRAEAALYAVCLVLFALVAMHLRKKAAAVG
ncbi:MAG TPA: MFS transporter [Actinocrinis sp.]|uniref:MFS transporter n=1 Tax=Actinocrinis sp. TaxID=1920516 RepID=UPI002DDCA4A7|nr:MFS transporter [Actinocrinis sp.]HEV2343646.1 MFS transporter [Actinocrinis sp.]